MTCVVCGLVGAGIALVLVVGVAWLWIVVQFPDREID